MNNNFQWTDELVKQYAEASATTTIEWFKKFCNNSPKDEYKVKLFTTEDGEDVHEGEGVWFVNRYFDLAWHHFDNYTDIHFPDLYKYFKSKELARQYIFANKPIEVSYRELSDFIWKEDRPVTPQKIYEFFTKKNLK